MINYAFLIISLALIVSDTASAVDLVSKGKPVSVIILGNDAIPAEKTAATELQSFIKQISGAQIPIVASEALVTTGCKVYIGQTAQTKSALPGYKWESLVHDGILIKRVGSDLVLAGDRPRGTLYAVYEYLEGLGVRFYAQDERFIPEKSTISLPKTDKFYVPKLRYREATYMRVMRKNSDFCARLKLNGHHHPIPETLGGNYTIIGFCHTFDEFLPAAKYFEAHPEWYSLKSGRRIGGQIVGQLCLTNPEMKKEFIKQTLEQIRQNPTAGMISVSQNDGSGPCECDVCKAEVAKLGNQTDLLLQFVNDVAVEVEKEYPTFLVETLAYSYTRKPPVTVRPRHNVLVRLCTGVDCSQPVDSNLNRACMNDLIAWSKITDKLFIWDYTVNFADLHLPFPNTPNITKNIRTFVANKAIGLHEQGDLYNPDLSMQPLKTYLFAKLMWDPSLSQEKLTKEFLNGYYGAAARSIYAYIKLSEQALKKSGAKLPLNAEKAPFMTPDVMVKAFELFDQAEKAVSGNAKLTKRVKLQRMAVEKAWTTLRLNIRGDVARRAGFNERKMVDDYINMAKETGNVFIGEQVLLSWDEFRYNALGDIGSTTIPVPDRVKNLPATDWKEINLGRVRLCTGAARFVDDHKAITGKAVRMDGGSLDWATQIVLSEYDIKEFQNAEIIFSIKCLDRATQGLAFDLGIYDSTGAKRASGGNSYYLQDIKDDDYHEYSAGVHKLGEEMFIYAAPPGNAKQLEAFYIDRIYLVKSDSK